MTPYEGGVLITVALIAPFGVWFNARTARSAAKEAAKEAAAEAVAEAAAETNRRLDETARAARLAAEIAAEVKEGTEVNNKLLDGRLTQFFKANDEKQERSDKALEDLKLANAAALSALWQKIDDAFERGRGVGHDEAVVGPMADSQARIEEQLAVATVDRAEVSEHLKQQDRDATKKHEEVRVMNGGAKHGADPHGARGEQGEQGERGDEGARGEKGDTGKTGPKS